MFYTFSAPITVPLICLALAGQFAMAEPFRIRIIDDSNAWPVPLVELRTTHGLRFVSDNAGVIAVDAPELMNREVWFAVQGHGYAVAPDGFGNRGVKLVPSAGGTHTLKVTRQLAAKRLGIITGGGLFAESQQLDAHLDWEDQGIFGCDSVQNVVHNDRLFWCWGDTVLPRYPLGRFHMIGATTSTTPLQSFQPPIQLRYRYFTDASGIPRNVAQLPGAGPTWLSGLVSLTDRAGRPHLGATYSKITPPLEEYERGLCEWNEATGNFEVLQRLWTKTAEQPTPPRTPHGHPVTWVDDQGVDWLLFGDPFPTLKCRPHWEDWSRPEAWQTLAASTQVTRGDGQGIVEPHRGAIAWNAYRGRWVTVFTELKGANSYLGELWYAEADEPLGPWQHAVHIVTHDHYSFYNPQLHAAWTDPESSILLFEGTFTHTFSKTTSPTPRYNYNQVLYRLDLDELAGRLPPR